MLTTFKELLILMVKLFYLKGKMIFFYLSNSYFVCLIDKRYLIYARHLILVLIAVLHNEGSVQPV